VSSAFEITSVTLDTPRGDRHALVATPTRHLRIGVGDVAPDERGGRRESPLVADALRKQADARLMIFRGRDDSDTSSWAIAEGATEAQAAELGENIVRSHLPFWRQLAASGLVLLVHLDLDERTRVALEAGRRIVVRELRLKSRTEGTLADETEEAIARLDLWILKHLTFFFGLSFKRAVASTLPDMMPMLEQRDVSLRRLLAAVPVSRLNPGA